MKRGAIVAGLASMFLAMGCGTDVELGNRPQFSQGGSVLTVLAFNGITGEALTGATMKVRIGPNEITATANGNAYTFNNLPAGIHPIFASVASFLDFAGVTPTLAGTDLVNPAYTTASLAMYPQNSVANPYTVKVYDNRGDAVAGGKLIMTMSTPPGLVYEQAMTALIGGAYGLKPTVKQYDIAGGVVTIPVADLIWGAEYMVEAYGATNAAGQFLMPAGAQKILPSKEYPQEEIFLGKPSPTLVVVKASNEVPNNEKAGPALTVWFSQPMERCVEASVHDFFTPTTTVNNDPTTTQASEPTDLTKDNAAFAPSADGLSLVITPTVATPDANDTATVTLSNIEVKPKGEANDQCKSIFTEVLLRGAAGTYASPTFYIYKK